jgi:hypothetical protein
MQAMQELAVSELSSHHCHCSMLSEPKGKMIDLWMVSCWMWQLIVYYD